MSEGYDWSNKTKAGSDARDKMATTGATLAELDPWDRINAMPDDRPLKTSEAAILMTFSVSTLERMRGDGTGPDYFQGGIRRSGKDPAAGVNQHIRYFKADIKSWFAAGKVSSTMQAAKLKGQLFASIFDLAESLPFYIDPATNTVAGMVEHTPIETVIERLGEWEIVWMPATEACSRSWSNLAAHRALAGKLEKALSDIRQGIAGGLEATELNEIVPQGRNVRVLRD
jgi:hypothetical protein